MKILQTFRTFWSWLLGRPNISGAWTFEITVDETGCGGGVVSSTVLVRAAQTGASILLSMGAYQLSGTLSGRLLSASGRYLEGGQTTEEHLTATLDDAGTSMTGASVWTWGQGSGSPCCGTATFSAGKE